MKFYPAVPAATGEIAQVGDGFGDHLQSIIHIGVGGVRLRVGWGDCLAG
jgi:hypothetical protein